MPSLWSFIQDSSNREVLAWCGGGIAVVVTGGWALFTYFFPPDAKKSAASTTPNVTQSGTGIASGGNTTISAPVNIGLDEKGVAAALKPLLKEQQEGLIAEIAREKGVPVAPIREMLIKLGEAGVSDEAIPQRLDAKADELIKLREEIAQFRQGPAELVSFAQRAQALINQGDLDGARAALAEGRAKAHNLREQASRYEADFLAREAQVDHLQLDYVSAAAKYQEAATLVVAFDDHKRWEFLLARAGELHSRGEDFGEDLSVAGILDEAPK